MMLREKEVQTLDLALWKPTEIETMDMSQDRVRVGDECDDDVYNIDDFEYEYYHVTKHPWW